MLKCLSKNHEPTYVASSNVSPPKPSPHLPFLSSILDKLIEKQCICRERGTLLHCWWECQLAQPLRKTVWRFLTKEKQSYPVHLGGSVGKHLPSAQVVIPRPCDPALCQAPCSAGSLPLPLPLPLLVFPLSLSLSLSLSNTSNLKKRKKKD